MGEIPIFLATSNLKKAKRVTDQGLGIALPHFDEESIKNKIDRNLGLGYPVEISRIKLSEQLKKEENKGIVVVSDSVIAVEGDNSLIPVNRDDDPNYIDQTNNEIKNGQPVYFLGASSFGIFGEPPYTLLTYFKIKPALEERIQIPINIDELSVKFPNFEFGIVDGAGKFLSVGENDFNKGRPYISGLTPDLVSLVKEYANIHPLIEVLKNQIATYPFNTIIFYDLINQGLTYEQIVLNWRKIFEDNGGNCSFHSLYFSTKAQELGYEPRICLFPSKNPNHELGHSAVLIRNYFFDSGLSLPFPLTFNLQPIEFGNGKKSFLNKNGLTVNKNGKNILFSLKELISKEEYLVRLPEILSKLHQIRSTAKKDFHDSEGNIISRELIELK